MQTLNLSSENHGELWLNTFPKFFQNNSYTDVTLVSDDRVAIEAHKIVLASGSQVFSELLQVDNPKPLLFLRGIKGSCLHAIVEFIYNGAVRVLQNDVEYFMKLAKELEVNGLYTNEEIGTVAHEAKIELERNEDISSKVCSSCDFICESEIELQKHSLETHSGIVRKEEKPKLHEYVTPARKSMFSKWFDPDQDDYTKSICKECEKLISRGKSGTPKGKLSSTPLTNHLRDHHPSLFQNYLVVRKQQFEC